MALLDFLKPAPYKKEIEDEEEIKKSYKYWRFRVFYGMYAGYILYYFSRKSFTFAMPSMMADLGFDKSQLGILGSVLAMSYGISKFLSGLLSDRSNPRYFMAIGLMVTGCLNILFGMSSSILFFVIFWGLNGCFQGWGWPPCTRLLTHWYSQKERGTWWGFTSSSQSVGGALIPLVAAFCAQYWGWRYAMFVPGWLCIIGGLFLINRLRDSPQSLGLPPIEKFKNELPQNAKAEDEKVLSVKEILFTYVLRNKFIWVLAASYFFVYIIRTAVTDWSALFLYETKGYSALKANACVSFFEIGGCLGALTAGWASDRIFQARRGPISALFSFGVAVAVLAFWLSPAGSVVLDSALLFVIGFLIFGPQMLIGMAAAELSHKKAAGTANGFVGWVSYIGAATAGYPLGKLTQEWGWQGFFTIVACCGLASVCLLLPLWNTSARTKKHELQTEPLALQEETTSS